MRKRYHLLFIEAELCNVKTVVNMPISDIAKREDLVCWPHLHGIDIPSIEDGEVSLLIGLKKRLTLFLRLELKTGGDSLGWTVMCPIGDHKEDPNCSVIFVFTKESPDTRKPSEG